MLLSEVDENTRGDHYYLTPDDSCLYLLEYTSGRDYSFSKANQIITNLKKKPSNSHRADYRYKQIVIRQASNTLAGALRADWLDHATLVPVPGSKSEEHPDYDDRMERICLGIRADIDVRNLVKQTQSTVASHEAGDGKRISVDELIDLYEIDDSIAEPPPTDIAVVDDVLTAGTHFRAMKTVLNERWPNVRVTGIFIARRVFPEY
ncbi:MAG: hypothetical protein AAFO17_14450 [Pseudomonadota bacterium]